MPQTGHNIIVAYKVEATLNTAPGATSAEQLRLTPSPGLSLRKELVRSAEMRSDLMTAVPRHGSRHVEGSYSGELSVGSFDTLLAAIARATIVSATTLTQASASLASISFTTNTVQATTTSTGSGFLQAGLRVGDVFRITGTSGANNNLNAQVHAVTTHTLTCQTSAFTTEATAITSFSLTIGKKIENGTTPVRRSYYFDQYYQDIDLSEVFGGCRATGFRLRGSPNGMAEIEIGVMGMSASALATGASPYYTSPTQYTSDPLTFVDAYLGFGGATLAVGTGIEINYQVNSQVMPVIGSTVVPDVFDNEARLSGSLTLLREDLDYLTGLANETEYELFVLLQEAESDPKSYFGLFIPRIVLANRDGQLGGGGALVETIPWEAGFKPSATGYDQTLLTICTAS